MGVGDAPGCALGRRSAFLPAPTRRVQRPFVATFRDASEAPETGGGKGRGAEGSPRPGPARAVAFCSPAPAESSSQNSTSLSPLLVGKHLFRAGKDSESPPASFSNLPPASSYSRLLREGAELEEGAANVLLFTRARRFGSLAAPSTPASASRTHTPGGITCSPPGPADAGNSPQMSGFEHSSGRQQRPPVRCTLPPDPRGPRP